MASRILKETINQQVVKASYAVRGEIVLEAGRLAKLLENKNHGLPFKEIINCNIGNPQQLKQKPLTFNRDVLSLMLNPELQTRCKFPSDVIARANKYLATVPSMGAYTDSQGISAVRDEIVQFLLKRDGVSADPNNIFLTNGASEGVRFCLNTGINDGMLAPIPQYPLYSALSTLQSTTLVPYELDESRNWECSISSVKASLQKANSENVCVRSMVVINPGNPTGQVMTTDSMEAVVDLCKKESICLMADEVYQENIWKSGAKFVSFRKVAAGMKAFEGTNPLQMVSFHSVSKVTFK